MTACIYAYTTFIHIRIHTTHTHSYDDDLNNVHFLPEKKVEDENKNNVNSIFNLQKRKISAEVLGKNGHVCDAREPQKINRDMKGKKNLKM